MNGIVAGEPAGAESHTPTQAGGRTYGDLFTGFGGATIGALAAGLRPLWGVEYRADVAAVANANLGGHVRVVDVLACDPADFAPVDVLHASPPCFNFSVAKAGAAETPHDLALASKVAEFVTVLRPAAFTLENVMAYKDSQSWRIIEQALFDAGYWVHQDVCNSADFGVPQTRKRLIVRAVLGGFVPYLPAPVPWIGWYAAVADLLPDLPDSQLAPWQLARLPEHLAQAIAFGSNGNAESWGDHHAAADEPMLAVAAQTLGRSRAVLISKTADKFGDGLRAVTEPAHTIGANEHGSKAVLIKGGDFSGEDGIVMCAQESPAFGIGAGRSEVHRAVLVNEPETYEAWIAKTAPYGGTYQEWQRMQDNRAVLVGGGNTNLTQVDSKPRQSNEPAFTITANTKTGDNKAVLMAQGVYGDKLTMSEAGAPSGTITANENQTSMRAIVASRVVSMSPRCLARFQSFPDWYVLPEKRTLAALGIGNAAPPLMMQRVFEGLTMELVGA